MEIPKFWLDSLKKDFETRYKSEHQTEDRWEWYKKSNIPCIKRMIKDQARFKRGIRFIKIIYKDGCYSIKHLHSNGNWRVTCAFQNTKKLMVACDVCRNLEEKHLFELSEVRKAIERKEVT